jgi:23S rRNA (guanine2445-N2)-methyltransferase / 23S rRNA (guanine2069-N7)-methyltransferase
VYSGFISCPKGIEPLLEKELALFSIPIEKRTVGGVFASFSLEAYYHLVMHTRLANRVMLFLFSVPLKTTQNLHEKSVAFDWDTHFDETETISIDFKGTNEQITNGMYGAQLIKDGISDFFRFKTGERPSVDKKNPNIQIRAYLKKGEVSVYLDPMGLSLHQRGYRLKQGSAPIKENIAAAILMQADWASKAERNHSLIDPFCGSGTLLVEGAFIATKTAPGLIREKQSLSHWKQHDTALWESTIEKAKAQITPFKGTILGFDNDAAVLKMAEENIENAGLSDCITVSKKEIGRFTCPTHLKEGLVICNPPYGERLSDVKALLPVYQTLGRLAKQACPNWTLGVITNQEKLSRAIGLKSSKRIKLKNGALDCQFALFELDKDNQFNPKAMGGLSDDGKMLLNRLKKNKKKLNDWLNKENITSYRLYDADLPDFNAAIDIYEDWAHVQEYAPPKTIDEKKATRRIALLCDVLVDELGMDEKKIVLKQRKRQKDTNQYDVQGEKRERFLVQDGKMQCFVNLRDYIDTGLFLDHRRLRKTFSSFEGKTFLNLFCYTGVASLHAASANNVTTNVDLSKTYLNWAKDNFRANHLTIDKHRFIHADVMSWLEKETGLYDVIFCDPPSFSNSKRMTEILDIQRDHSALIQHSMARLNENGVLYFSCNLKKFVMDNDIKSLFDVQEITKETTSRDFDSARVRHHAYKIQRKIK